ncbi:glycosyltransferase family 2 protein [Algibacter aquimarinus]|uniref:Glycosyltransferase n=1 Tax=Algibacter aquimarinus TaxID=1136748 RepID=A0ABP9HQU4_9FLAO
MNSKHNKNLISVLVMAYNHEAYLAQCLYSILNQKTNFSFEIILGEDASSDETRAICLDFAEKYPDKIKLFLRLRKDVIYINGSPTGRFNFIESLKSCTGKYVALCDGDDYWSDSLKLQKQVDFLEANPDYNICFHKANLLQKHVLKPHQIPNEFEGNTFHYIELLKHFNFITTASVVFRNLEKEDLPNWFLNIPLGDMALYKIVSKNKKIHCLPEIMSVYRIHDAGLWSGLNIMQEKYNYLNFYKIIYKILNYEEKVVVKNKMRKIKSEIANIKFPKNHILSRIYFNYLNLKF